MRVTNKQSLIECHLSALSATQSMRCIVCAKDCGSEQPEKHAGLHTAKWDQIELDILVFFGILT